MQMIYYMSAFALLWIHVAALTAVAGPRFNNNWAIARACALLIVVMVGFCIEHMVGLGSPRFIWPITSSLAVMYLWQNRTQLMASRFLQGERAFGFALAYGFTWKFLYPTIYNTSERITDLVFINNYLAGDRLPPPDLWMPGYTFDFYYALMHYGAALAGRILQMPNGVTYNFAFIFLTGMTLNLACDFSSRFIPKLWPRLLLMAALVSGGTGASIFTHLITDPKPAGETPDYNAYMWGSARFIGGYEKMFANEFGKKIFPPPADPNFTPRELGVENFGYQYFTGDYHPPVGGYFILMLVLALMAALEAKNIGGNQKERWAQVRQQTRSTEERRKDQVLQAMLGLSVPAVFATNTWIFPLQVFLIGSWALWRIGFLAAALASLLSFAFIDSNFTQIADGTSRRIFAAFVAISVALLVGVFAKDESATPDRNPEWKMLIGGGIAGFLLLYPFLYTFTNREVASTIERVLSEDHTKIPQFMGAWWPIVIFLIIGFFKKEWRNVTLFFTLIFTTALILMELYYVSDGTGGGAKRLNTTMKWGGWIWTGALLTVGTFLLTDKRILVRIPTCAALLLVCVQFWDIAHYWNVNRGSDWSQFNGSDVWTRDPIYKRMFRYLYAAPKGIVVENHYSNGYHEGGAFSAFTRQPFLLGWINQIITWHGGSEEIWQTLDAIHDFYSGKLPNKTDWLVTQKVKYIVWNQKDADAAPDVWEKINAEISSEYGWKLFGMANNHPIGIWIRKSK